MQEKLIKITTLIEPKQYDILHKHSYKGKKKDQKEGQFKFSEHLRNAVEQYNERLEKEKNNEKK